MRGLSSRFRLFMRCFLYLLIGVGGLLQAPELSAIPLEALDSAGEPVDLKADIANDPEHFILLMRQEFARGNVASAGYYAEQLVRLQPQLIDARAIYSIFLTSQGREGEAREQLGMVKYSATESVLTLCADALILQREKKYAEAIRACERAASLEPSHPYPHNILGRVYLEQGQTGKAIESFQKAVALKPDFLVGYINLGAVSYLAGEHDQAIAAFSKAISLDANATSAYYGIAVVYETLGENKQAIQALQSCLKSDPNHQPALESLGKLQISEGLFNDALQTGQQMKKLHMDNIGFLVLGEAYLQAGKVDEAESFLKQVKPEGPEALYLLGYCAMVQGKYQDAKKMMEVVLEKEPRHFGAFSARAVLKLALNESVQPKEELVNSWDAGLGKMLHFIGGCVALTQNDWAGVFNEFKESAGMINGYSLTGIDQDTLATNMNPQEGRHLALGVLYYFKRLYGPSLDELTQEVALNNHSILGNYWAAQVCLQQKNRAKAMEFFEASLHDAPKFFAALYALGELHLLAGNFDEAANYYRQAASVQRDPGVLIKLGLYSEQKGNNVDAAKYYQSVIEVSPNFFVGYNQLAWLYAKQGIKLGDAMKLALRADQLQPGNTSILDTIGWIHFQKKEYSKAIPFFERALSVNQNNPTVHYHLGRSFLAMGKDKEGLTHLKRALELSSSFEEAADARKLLDGASKMK